MSDVGVQKICSDRDKGPQAEEQNNPEDPSDPITDQQTQRTDTTRCLARAYFSLLLLQKDLS